MVVGGRRSWGVLGLLVLAACLSTSALGCADSRLFDDSGTDGEVTGNSTGANGDSDGADDGNGDDPCAEVDPALADGQPPVPVGARMIDAHTVRVTFSEEIACLENVDPEAFRLAVSWLQTYSHVKPPAENQWRCSYGDGDGDHDWAGDPGRGTHGAGSESTLRHHDPPPFFDDFFHHEVSVVLPSIPSEVRVTEIRLRPGEQALDLTLNRALDGASTGDGDGDGDGDGGPTSYPKSVVCDSLDAWKAAKTDDGYCGRTYEAFDVHLVVDFDASAAGSPIRDIGGEALESLHPAWPATTSNSASFGAEDRDHTGREVDCQIP